MKKKFYLSILFFLVILLAISFLNRSVEFKKLKRNKIFPILTAIKNNEMLKYINLGYKNNFLPNTSYGDLKFNIIKLNLDSTDYKVGYGKRKSYYKPFYIEEFNNFIYIFQANGKIHKFSKDKLNFKKKIDPIEIESYFNNLKNIYILDTLRVKKSIFVSFKSIFENCEKFNILKFDIENFSKFEVIYKPQECASIIQAGSMELFNFNNKEGILFTISGPHYYLKNEKFESQNNESIFGKILFINFSDLKINLISKGFRNHQGLVVSKRCILSTDHGPEGGDEINNIKVGGNYGWPIASYGEPYEKKELANYKFPKFLKSHEENGFIEPVYTFLPSIAISKIIELKNNFSSIWQDNFLVASLNARSLFRIKLSKNCERMIYSEKIYIGQRIRDILLSKDEKNIFLALEDEGAIGLLKQ